MKLGKVKAVSNKPTPDMAEPPRKSSRARQSGKSSYFKISGPANIIRS